jgi:hypothetical protein
MAKVERRETVWKIAGGFLIACVSSFKRARWDIFALFWLLATLRIEAYSDFPESLSMVISRMFATEVVVDHPFGGCGPAP